MTRSTPTIRDTTLLFYEAEQAVSIVVGSTLWFEWVSKETSTTFSFHSDYGSYTARKERVGNDRGNWYWKASRKHQGTLYRAYLGKPEALTPERLGEVALTLSTRIQTEANPAQKVPEAGHPHQHRMHDDSLMAPLLETKLHPPQLPGGLVERTRLLTRLDSSFAYKLTLVLAPAGFGKTTLVNQWLTSHSTPPALAWVSLDAGDNDPLRFWRSVMTACQKLLRQEQRAAGHSALALLGTVKPPFEQSPIEMALTRLLNELTESSREGLLILDDYHVITEARLHETLAFFIDHLPKTLHVLLLSRAEPDFPLLRWRARGELCELYGSDLRFSSEETEAFLQQALPITISGAAFARLDKSLEGWAAGLRLLCLTLARWRTAQAIEQALLSLGERASVSSPHRSVLDYLVSEILETQPESMQHFLLRTSVLSCLCGPLCDVITESQNNAARLEAIEKAGLFLEALEGPGEWYRYHALFAEAMLREASRRLGEEVLSALSSRSSSWYEQQGMLTEAVEAALLANDVKRIARLVEQIAIQEPLYEPQTMLRWLKPIPEDLLQEHPMLCFISAIAYQAAHEARPIPDEESSRIKLLFQMAEEGWRRQENLPWLGTIWASRAISTLEQGSFSLALQYAQQALALLPQIDINSYMQIWHSACLLLVGMEKLLVGSLREAQPLILDALARSQALDYGYLTNQILLTLGRSYLLAGEFHQAYATYLQVLSEARLQEDHELTADALLALAWLKFEWNDLITAEQQVQEAVEHIRFARHQKQDLQERAAFQLTLHQHAQGQTTEALTILSTQLTRIESNSTSSVLEFLPFVVEWQGRLSLTAGELEAVEQQMKTLASQQEKMPFLQDLLTQILAGRLLLAKDQAKAAQLHLEDLLARALAQHHQYYALQIQLLLALHQAACKQNQQAHHQLRHVLSEAKPEGFLRLFLNEGEPLARLLRSLLPTIKDNTLRSYIQSILQAFAQNTDASPANCLLFEPLSSQEQRVLRLLAAGCTNKEIAHELIVSVNTVKDHVKHLYGKLGVNNRLQASLAAQLLKLD